VPLTAPVPVSAVNPTRLSGAKRFTTQTGAPTASSGNGAPKVLPFEVFVAASSSTQGAPDAPSQPARHTRSRALEGIGKLCESPVKPLSRSVPIPGVVSRSSRGPPAGLAGH
jgi:hypothetical protein